MVTIIMPVSRIDYLDQIFARLEILECDKEQTNLLTYVDGDWTLFEKTRNLTVNSKFKERLCVYRKKGLPNVGSVIRRRKRIADIHNEVKEYLKKSEYYFLLEDDTIFPLDTLKVLLNNYSLYPFAGFISGIELGRWGFTHIGAWKVNDIYNPTEITSVPMDEGLQEVDAAGLYCCLTKNYFNYTFEPFDSVFGPDVSFGLWLRRQGLKNYIHYGLKCTHLTKKEPISFKNTPVIQVQFTKEDDSWKLKTD
jgi:hypothetical protein